MAGATQGQIGTQEMGMKDGVEFALLPLAGSHWSRGRALTIHVQLSGEGKEEAVSSYLLRRGQRGLRRPHPAPALPASV